MTKELQERLAKIKAEDSKLTMGAEEVESVAEVTQLPALEPMKVDLTGKAIEIAPKPAGLIVPENPIEAAAKAAEFEIVQEESGAPKLDFQPALDHLRECRRYYEGFHGRLGHNPHVVLNAIKVLEDKYKNPINRQQPLFDLMMKVTKRPPVVHIPGREERINSLHPSKRPMQ